MTGQWDKGHRPGTRTVCRHLSGTFLLYSSFLPRTHHGLDDNREAVTNARSGPHKGGKDDDDERPKKKPRTTQKAQPRKTRKVVKSAETYDE